MKQVLRKDLQLETCGETGENFHNIKSHENGCYIRFSNEKIVTNKVREDVTVDYDSKGKIVGIEFYDGL